MLKERKVTLTDQKVTTWGEMKLIKNMLFKFQKLYSPYKI